MNIYRLLHSLPISQGMRLHLQRYLMDKEVDRETRAALKNGASPDDVWQHGNWQIEYQFLEDDEARYHSRQLLGRARRLRIPVPPLMDGNALSNDYQRSDVDGGRYFLSIAGEQKVRAAIREEERYRSERWARRIPYITALAGLIGTATGLIALLTR